MSEKETCLICKSAIQQRGLCTTHYSRFVRAKNALAPGKQGEFESLLIEKGLLSPPKPRGRQVEKDVFADIASLLRNGKSLRELEISEIEAEIEKSAASLRRRSSVSQTEIRPKKSGRKTKQA